MAKPYDSIRLVFGGDISAVQEWSCGLTIASLTAPNMNSVNQAALGTFTNAAMAVLKTAYNTGLGTTPQPLKNLMGLSTRFTFVRAYKYQAGSDVAQLQYEAVFGSPIVGVGATAMPSQTCQVHSLRTEQPGRRGRGRIYLPATGQGLAANNQYQNGTVDGFARTSANMLHDITVIGVGQDDSTVVVGSQFGAYRVTVVEVDTEPDVQRRRSDKIVAQYTASVTVPAS